MLEDKEEAERSKTLTSGDLCGRSQKASDLLTHGDANLSFWLRRFISSTKTEGVHIKSERLEVGGVGRAKVTVRSR